MDDAARASRGLGKRADMVVHVTDPYNAEPPRGALAGTSLTPLDAFYVRNHGPVPARDPAAYRLRIDGLVQRPREISLGELRDRFPERQMAATLQCAGNRRAAMQEVAEIPGEAPWGRGRPGRRSGRACPWPPYFETLVSPPAPAMWR
jgi:sulfite oxidase